MIRILLVDDDQQAIEGIAQNVNWAGLGIGECCCAFSAKEAKRIILEKDVSIVITDIEMPEESGLELVQWINDTSRNIVSIFLTSYSDFDYTSRALRLRSSDYLLKPASYRDVEEAVRRASSQLGQLRQNETASMQAMYWNDSLPALQEQFWSEVVCGLMPRDEAHIARQAKKRHIPYAGKAKRPILFELSDTISARWGQDLVDVAMRNVLGEVFDRPGHSPVIVHLSGNNYCAVVDESYDDGELPGMCRDTVNVFESLFNGNLMCVIGKTVTPGGLRDQVKKMLTVDSVHPDSELTVIHGDRDSAFKEEMTRWIQELSSEKYAQVLQQIHAYFQKTQLREAQLLQLHRSIQWKMYQIIVRKHLDVNSFFADETLMRLSEKAGRSPADLLEWLEYMLRRIAEEDSETKDATVLLIQRYIKAHISEDLNRETIAATTFLSVDHISHLFTQKTGQCLSDYIITQRIEKAKQLLRTTDLPVAKVAIAVGYNNISYFSRLFKRETGMTPQRFRNGG